MAIYDFGRVKAFATSEALDIFFPYDTTLVGVMKQKGGIEARWNNVRRCWSATPDRAKVENTGQIAAKLEALLYASAPDVWKGVSEGLRKLVCVTPRFEIGIGASGMRLCVPINHLIEKQTKQLPGVTLAEGAWYLTPQDVMTNAEQVKIILAAILGQDKKAFLTQVNFLEPRTIAGGLTLGSADFDDLVIDHEYVIADRSFIRKADINMAKLDVQAYPLQISGRKSDDDGQFYASLSYVMPQQAYDILYAHTKPLLRRMLNESDAISSWTRLRRNEMLDA